MAIRLPSREEVEIDIERLTRDEFIDEVFAPHYQAGEHVAFIGPTQSGKTTVAYEMLDSVATPELPAVVLVMKPRDQVVVDWTKRLGFKKTETWPPVLRRGFKQKSGGFMKKRRGWVYWPRQSLSDVERDDAMLEQEFRRVLTECYRKGDRIVFADEVLGLTRDLNLDRVLNAIWERGSSMGCGLWAATQRPFNAPVIMYGAASHLVLFNDPDKRSVDRYKEIGGVDPDVVVDTVRGLKRYEFLYIGRTMNEEDDGMSAGMAIVGAN